MKQTRKLIAALLALTLLLAALPVSGLAASKVKTLKYDKWYSTQDPNPNIRTPYKLKISSERLVYVSWKKADTRSPFAWVEFYKDEGCSKIICGIEFSVTSSGKKGVVLYPGTYYVAMMDVVSGSKVKLSAMSVSKFKAKNTSASKAVSINAGKTTELVFDKKSAKTRWYKLKLTKKQAVTIYGTLDGVTLYDSKMKQQTLRSGWDSKRAVEKYTSKSKLAKGTYYLKITENSDDLSNIGQYRSFFWK